MSKSKTNYTKQILDDYCVLDVETTGLSPYHDEIIEIGMLRVRNNEVAERYSQLIKPRQEISEYIAELTGITNEMVKNMPAISDVKDEVLCFIGDDVILGHRTYFDMSFLYKAFDGQPRNQYMDTYQFARKIYPELKRHGLKTLTRHLGLSPCEHRAIADCIATKELYDAVKAEMATKDLSISDLWRKKKKKSYPGIDYDAIKVDVAEIDEDGFFFNKNVVITGKLAKMVRKDALQLLVNLGAIIQKNVTKSTEYLILGDNDYNPILRGEKSQKLIRAEELKLKGHDLEIIDELTFYDLISE